MAVAHSAASESHTGTTGSTNQAAFSFTHVQSGTPQGVVVFVHTLASVADLVTSVTYGGVALTRVTGGSAQDTAGELGRTDTFFLGAGLGTGNQTITVNRTNNATVMYASAATVTAAANTAIPEATIVLVQGDGPLTVQSVNDTSPGVNSLRYAAAYSGLVAPPPAGTGSTLLTDIDFGQFGVAMVRETTAGQGARNVGFNNATTDDRAAVHLAIRELVPRIETPIVGAFTLTGNNANLVKASPKVIAAAVGIFTLTGNVANFAQQYKITIDAGGFALTGNAATLKYAAVITADTGTFSITGNAATLASNAVIAANTGTFALSGQPATLRQNYRLAADTGGFALNGQPATLRRAFRFDAATGPFALVGNPATTRHAYAFAAETGTFTATGQPATLRHVFKVEADTGTFALTGGSAAFAHSRNLNGATGTFSLTGNPATLVEINAYEIAATTGTFVLSGSPAQLRRNRLFTADTGAFALLGRPAGLEKASARRRNVLIF